jgi:hypothetical protein
MFQLGKTAEKHREMAPSSKHNIPVVHPPCLPHVFFLLPKEKGELEERSDNKANHWKHEQSDSYCEEQFQACKGQD